MDLLNDSKDSTNSKDSSSATRASAVSNNADYPSTEGGASAQPGRDGSSPTSPGSEDISNSTEDRKRCDQPGWTESSDTAGDGQRRDQLLRLLTGQKAGGGASSIVRYDKLAISKRVAVAAAM